MKKNIEIIGMIYKSPSYLTMMINQFLSEYNQVDDWNIKFRILVNNPQEKLLPYLAKAITSFGDKIIFDIYEDNSPIDYYLNRVYRCWNYGGRVTKYDNICFVNSDMIFSKNWLGNLLKHHDGINIPCSKLFESGKMPSGKWGETMHFGSNPVNMNYLSWYQYAEYKQTIDKGIGIGGLYMPCIFSSQRFYESGGYPEGNIYVGGAGQINTTFVKSGDDYFFHDILEQKFGMRHITSFDSLVYHFQEGELCD